MGGLVPFSKKQFRLRRHSAVGRSNSACGRRHSAVSRSNEEWGNSAVGRRHSAVGQRHWSIHLAGDEGAHVVNSACGRESEKYTFLRISKMYIPHPLNNQQKQNANEPYR